MMRSLFSGVSGLRVHQTKMDVIAHNIANVNTIGYKSSRATFMDAFYQRLQGASGPNADTGRAGTNPQQIGLGAMMGSIDTIMTQGASMRTDNAFDVMIQGNGFFIVSDNTGVYFTRAGNVKVDNEFNLHINGMRLMGWDAVWNRTNGQYEIQQGPVRPLDIGGDKQYMPPKPTTIVEMVGNINPFHLNDDNKITRTMNIYDNVGTLYTVNVIFEYYPADATHEYSYWTYEFETGRSSIENGDQFGVLAYTKDDKDMKNPYALLIDIDPFRDTGTPNPLLRPEDLARPVLPGNGDEGNWPASGPITTSNMYNKGTLIFDRQGQMVYPPANETSMVVFPVSVLDPTSYFGDPYDAANRFDVTYGANPPLDWQAGTIKLDFKLFTQFDGERITAKIFYKDGNEPGTLEDYAVGPDGMITGRYSNGVTRPLGQIPLAKFRNPAGLEKIGSNLFSVTNNSGQFNGIGDVGSLIGGALEMSNVDLSQEFTEMITTQRGFQANSRVITVSDEMLLELVNLKR